MPESLLAEAIAAAVSGARRARVPLDELRAAAQERDASLAGAPDGRERLAEAITQAELEGRLETPKAAGSWDRSVLPALPRWVARPRRVPAARAETERRTWHASLGWAAGAALRAQDLEVLRRVSDWLAAGGPRRVVPLAERSLEILGHEKALGDLLRGPLFGDGRLTLDLLGAVRTSPPFVFTRTGPGPVALVAENSATYRTLASLAPGSAGLIGLVAFGGGNGFTRSVEFFAELAEPGGPGTAITDVRYFGDLDADGLRIPAAASRLAVDLGLPPVIPAPGLYRRLLSAGHLETAEPLPAEAAATLASWLPAELRDGAATLLTRGARLAQEAVGRDLLIDDPTWASGEEMGLTTNLSRALA